MPLVHGPVHRRDVRRRRPDRDQPRAWRRTSRRSPPRSRAAPSSSATSSSSRARCRPAQKVLAITGSNGKTHGDRAHRRAARAPAGLATVVAGNIGEPVLDVLDRTRARRAVARRLRARAVELPARDDVEPHADRRDGAQRHARTISTATPASPTTRAAKARIFAGARRAGAEPRRLRARCAMRLPGRIVQTFGAGVPRGRGRLGPGRSAAATPWLARGGALLLAASDLALVGRHNALNALAALALTSTVAKIDAKVLAALAAFRGLPHRMERVAEIGGVAVRRRFEGHDRRRDAGRARGHRPARSVLIAGGDGKGQDFAPLTAAVDAHCRAVLLIGRDAPLIARGARRHAARASRSRGTLDAAVARAIALAQPGDAVLLSPACASLDMFRELRRARRSLRGARCARARARGRPCVGDPSFLRRACRGCRRSPRRRASSRAMLAVRRVARLGGAAAARARAGHGLFGVDRDGRGVGATPATAPWYFLVRHAVFVAVGLVAALVAFQVPLQAWQRLAPWLFIAGARCCSSLVLDSRHRPSGQRRAALAVARASSTCSPPSS